jgi:hypothetical protein
MLDIIPTAYVPLGITPTSKKEALNQQVRAQFGDAAVLFSL